MTIRLKNIQFYGYHGVNEHERQFGGKFELDVEVEADTSAAESSDNLADTIDYVELQQCALAVASEQRLHLLEALATRIADAILKQFDRVQIVTIRLRKPGASLGGLLDTVEVECQLRR